MKPRFWRNWVVTEPIRLYRVEPGGGTTEISHQLAAGATLGIQVARVARRGTRVRLIDPLFRLCHEEGIPGAGPGGFVFAFSEDAIPGRYRILLEHGGIQAVREFALLPGDRRADRVHLHQSVRIAPGPAAVRELELYLSLPPTVALHQRLRELESSQPAPRISDLVGNEWLRLGPLDLAAPLTFGYEAQLEVRGFSVDAQALRDPALAEPAVDPRYLQPETAIESDHPEIRQLADRLRGETVAQTSAAIYGEVKQRIRYELQRAEYGALAGLQRGEGDCTEIAALYVALMRACGIPARVTLGCAVGSQELHAVAELHHRGLWIPVDITNHPTPFYGVPANFVVLLRANWMSSSAIEKQLSYHYRAQGADALQVRDRLALTAPPREKVRLASRVSPPSRVVQFRHEAGEVRVSHSRKHPLRGAVYLFHDADAPHINWIQPVVLAAGESTRVVLPPERARPLGGPNGQIRLGFVDCRDTLCVEQSRNL